MYQYFIKQYISRLTKADIKSFGLEQGISLTDEEVTIFYQTVKQDWETVLYGNQEQVFSNLKQQLNPVTYQKVIELYSFFYQKYQSFL